MSQWYHNSELYRFLKNNENVTDDLILESINNKSMSKIIKKIKTNKQLIEYLNIINFWCFDEYDDYMVNFIFSNKYNRKKLICVDHIFGDLFDMIYIIKHKKLKTINVNNINVIMLFKYLIKKFYKYTNEYINLAIKNGSLDVLKYTFNNSYISNDINLDNSNILHLIAIENNRFECLQYLHCIKYNFCENSCSCAALNGNIKILEYLHKNNYNWNEFTCLYAVESNSLNCLKYAIDNGCKYSKNCYYQAAFNGNLEILTYLLSLKTILFDLNVFYYAIINGHLDCVKFIYENITYNDDDLIALLKETNIHLNCIEFINSII